MLSCKYTRTVTEQISQYLGLTMPVSAIKICLFLKWIFQATLMNKRISPVAIRNWTEHHRRCPWAWACPWPTSMTIAFSHEFDRVQEQRYLTSSLTSRPSFNITLSPATLASSLTKWAKSGVTQQCRPGGPVHCMRAKATPVQIFYAWDNFQGGFWDFL